MRRLKSFLFTVFLFVFGFTFYAKDCVLGGQQLVPANSWIYEGINALFYATGKVSPVACAPLSVNEL